MKFVLIFILSILFLSCSGKSDEPTASALCNDGTLSYSKSCSGTCSGHGGVKTWYNNCGNGSIVSSISFDNKDLIEQKSIKWVGRWISNNNSFGIVHIFFTDKSTFTGIFYNSDLSLDSTFNSYFDVKYGLMTFLDIKNTATSELGEHLSTLQLKEVDGKMTGTINIHFSRFDEIRNIELIKSNE